MSTNRSLDPEAEVGDHSDHPQGAHVAALTYTQGYAIVIPGGRKEDPHGLTHKKRNAAVVHSCSHDRQAGADPLGSV